MTGKNCVPLTNLLKELREKEFMAIDPYTARKYHLQAKNIERRIEEGEIYEPLF